MRTQGSRPVLLYGRPLWGLEEERREEEGTEKAHCVLDKERQEQDELAAGFGEVEGGKVPRFQLKKGLDSDKT